MHIFKNGLRSAEAFRNENGSGADYLDEHARGGTLRLGRTALGGYVKFAVAGLLLVEHRQKTFFDNAGS